MKMISKKQKADLKKYMKARGLQPMTSDGGCSSDNNVDPLYLRLALRHLSLKHSFNLLKA